MELNAKGSCANPDCEGKGTLRCGRCKNARYCSDACQKGDWRFHKLLCKLFVSAEPRPDPYHRRVIILPVSGDKAVFSWLPILPCSGPDPATADLSRADQATIDHGHFALADDVKICIASDDPENHDSHKHVPHDELAIRRVEVYDDRDKYGPMPNRCFNRLFGDELAAPLTGPLIMVAKTIIDGKYFVVDIDTHRFTESLFGYLRKLKAEAEG